MAKLPLLFLLIFSSYAYSPKGMDLNKYKFSRYVKPQLKSILNEYTSLFISLNENLTPFKSVLHFYRDLALPLNKIKSLCKRLDNDTCQLHLIGLNTKLKEHLNSIDQIEFVLAKDQSLNQYLIGLGLLEEFKLHLLSTFLRIDGHIVEYRIRGQSTLSADTINHWITQLDFSLNMFLLSQADERIQNSLTAFWVDFIIPVNQIILPEDDMDFFKSKLTELNIRWNELHMLLTKKNILVSKHSNTLLNIMHNRWNNILKVTLKPI